MKNLFKKNKINYKDIFRSDFELLYIFKETLFHKFDIDINTEYKFLYDDFYDHVLSDTMARSIKKNINNIKQLFEQTLIQHMYSKEYSYLKFPENYPDVKKQLRLRKIKKIQDEKF